MSTRRLNLSPALWMVASAFFFAVMGIFVKCANRLPTWEIAFFRVFINFLLFLPWAVLNPSIVALSRKEPVALTVRGVSGCISVALYFYSVEHLRLADAAMLTNASPLIVLVISALFLGERLNARGVAFIGVAFTGIAFVLKPHFDMGSSQHTLAAVLGLIGAFTAAVAYIAIKVATRSIPPRLIVFTFAAVASAISFVPILLSYMPPTPKEWVYLLAAGVAATIAQELMTRGYVRLPASVASPLMLVGVIFAAMADMLVWSQLPDTWSVFGAILIGGGLYGAYRFRSARASLESGQLPGQTA